MAMAHTHSWLWPLSGAPDGQWPHSPPTKPPSRLLAHCVPPCVKTYALPAARRCPGRRSEQAGLMTAGMEHRFQGRQANLG